MSVDSMGAQANYPSRVYYGDAISADGRYIVFDSNASNLVIGDSNGQFDVFLHDNLTGDTRRVSVSSSGSEANGGSDWSSISSDGRFVTFCSSADNLVLGDSNGRADVFVIELSTGIISLVSKSSVGALNNASVATPALSADGRYVAFTSEASNLVPGDGNNVADIFIHDRQSGQTSRISVSSSGAESNGASQIPSIAGDGRYVAFTSAASNLVPGDTNQRYDVFIHDRVANKTVIVSTGASGTPANSGSYNAHLTAEGQSIVFDSDATNLVAGDTNAQADIFIHHLFTQSTSRMSVDSAGVQGNGMSANPAISQNGQFICFSSDSTNLVSGDTNGLRDIFVHDAFAGTTSRVSLGIGISQPNSSSQFPSISATGRYVTFSSLASNLVSGDTNGYEDVFLHDRGSDSPYLSLSGSCPGQISLRMTGLSPRGFVAVVHGPAGVFVKPTSPCAGILLGVSPPTLGAIVIADSQGTAVVNISAPASACGRSVQAVDATTCLATNVIVL